MHRRYRKLYAPEGDGGGAGGGTPPDPAIEIAALKAKIAALEAAPVPPKPPTPTEDPGLRAKAAADREAAERDSARSKRLEAAIGFNLKAPEFLKTNGSLLPGEVADIFKQAEKENYSDAIEKDSAIKSGIIQSFFAVQANVDMLTPGLKAQLDEYLKLTKTGKQDKAQHFYENVFEPTFENLKRVKKAEALSKGFAGGSDGDTQYKNRLIAGSKKHFLGEKS